jgi:hypothetical protein
VSHQHKKQVPKEVFLNPKIFLPILNELKESRYWRKRERSAKS